jgi:hypothetical protein
MSKYFSGFSELDMSLKVYYRFKIKMIILQRSVFRAFSTNFRILFQSFQTFQTFKEPASNLFLLNHGQFVDCKRFDVFHQNDSNMQLAIRQV